MSRFSMNVAVEGITDEAIVRRLLAFAGLSCSQMLVRNGKAELLKRLPGYNIDAQFANWFVLIDLDQKPACAPQYIREILPQPSPGMTLRIPVRTVEAWLLADRVHFAHFLHIPVQNIPLNPDLESDPKLTLINLARRCKKKSLREDIVPRLNSGVKVGPGYPSRVLEFLNHPQHPWRPEVAAENSDSLKRCINALKNWKQIGYHDPE